MLAGSRQSPGNPPAITQKTAFEKLRDIGYNPRDLIRGKHPMELTVKQKLFLKSRAHQMKPVVMAGQKGITESLIKETLAALEAHELIKIKIAGEREAREAAAQEISEKTGAALVQIVGGNATLFKKRKDKSQFQLPRE